jgi:hypothetical protein
LVNPKSNAVKKNEIIINTTKRYGVGPLVLSLNLFSSVLESSSVEAASTSFEVCHRLEPENN